MFSTIRNLLLCGFIVASLTTSCVNLTPPWEGVPGRDAAPVGPGSGGDPSALIDATGIGGSPSPGTVDSGAVISSGGSGGSADVPLVGSGGSDAQANAEAGVSASGGAGGSVDGRGSGMGGAIDAGAGGNRVLDAGDDDVPVAETGGIGVDAGNQNDAPLATGGTSGAGGATAGAPGTGGGTGGSSATGGAGGGATSDIIVNAATTYQTMDGFGAADVWASTALTAAQATLFFDPVSGIGLSLLHIGIDASAQPMGSAAAADAQAAASFGARVWASPWSPPADAKGNSNVNCTDANTAHLLTASYDAWASALAGFPATFKSLSGVQLYAISAQSEPDACSGVHASCVYTAAEVVGFAKVLGPKLAALSPPVKLVAPESAQWSNLWGGNQNYGTAILNDAAASAAIDILATHDRGGTGLVRPSAPAGNTHPIWQTSVYDESGASPDIAHGITIAQSIYAAVTSGGASAWHYWWLVPLSNDGQGLLLSSGDTNNAPKRLYTVGNFSKFVRPGYLRVGVSGPVPTGVQIAAFRDPVDNTIAIVAINSSTNAQLVSVSISGATAPSQVTPWLTSASDNLAQKTSIALSGGRFSTTLAAQTVATFVGKP